jgi:flagellar hook protein FlgE
LFTRAGNFTVAKDGSLLTASGDHVQGWNANGATLNLTGPIGNVMLPVTGVVPAVPTGNISLTANLNAAATVGGSNATFSAPVQVVDSQGSTHVLTFSFTKTAANAWSYTVSIPAADLKSGGSTQIATGNLTFDANGNLTSPASGTPVALKVTGLADGAADMNINWNLYSGTQGLLTQFAQTSGVSADSQDGLQAGQITKIAMGDNGAIIASYSNGQQSTIAQVALASIRNPSTMVSVGNNNFRTTIDTAAPAIGAANSGGRGKIVGGALESSTVDIAEQFTNLMAFQRSYEAASKVITTSDQMLQTLIAVKQ